MLAIACGSAGWWHFIGCPIASNLKGLYFQRSPISTGWLSTLRQNHYSNQTMVFILAALLLGIYANAIRIIHSDEQEKTSP